ncbi:MAG: hypothetical protein AB1489_29190 [Acidobacteriota bacterium]
MSKERPKYATFRDLHIIKQTPVPTQNDSLTQSDQSALSAKIEHSAQPTPDATPTQSVPQTHNAQSALSANQALDSQQANSNTTPQSAHQAQSVEPAQSANSTPSDLPSFHAKLATQSVPEAQSDQLTPSAKLAPIPNTAGHTSIPNLILDGLLPQLRMQEQVVYLRLYRLSHGFRSNTCRVGFDKLANTCNLSRREVIRSIERLEILGLIKRLGCNFKAKMSVERGNLYEVNLPEALSANQTQSAQQTSTVDETLSANQTPNKDHDDDPINKDHHQSAHTAHERETMTLYTSLTGNPYTKADRASYQKIKDVPLAAIEKGIKLAAQRSASRPNSLAYFLKEIANQANPPAPSRTQLKKEMGRIIKDMKDNDSRVKGYTTWAEFGEMVKERCGNEGLPYDNGLFEEIMKETGRP